MKGTWGEGRYLRVSQWEIGLLEEDVHMDTPHIQLPVTFHLQHVALWQPPLPLPPSLQCPHRNAA